MHRFTYLMRNFKEGMVQVANPGSLLGVHSMRQKESLGYSWGQFNVSQYLKFISSLGGIQSIAKLDGAWSDFHAYRYSTAYGWLRVTRSPNFMDRRVTYA